jgi:hypothetical protein
VDRRRPRMASRCCAAARTPATVSS